MTKIDQIKILDNKIRANRAKYDLDRKNAVISARSSGELDKYESLTGEDLSCKPDAIAQAKSEYSPLGKIFNKGLDKEDNKEGLLKRLKNFEDQQNMTNKVGKYTGGLYYDTNNNVNEYKIENYDKTSSIDSKFNTVNTFIRAIKKVTSITHKKGWSGYRRKDTKKKARFRQCGQTL